MSVDYTVYMYSYVFSVVLPEEVNYFSCCVNMDKTNNSLTWKLWPVKQVDSSLSKNQALIS